MAQLIATDSSQHAVESHTLERLDALLSTDTDVFWRHDVDFDANCAWQMAAFEHDRGICSTFYVMKHIALPYVDLFREIAEMGHALGVHCDLGLPRDAKVGTDRMSYAALRDYLAMVKELPMSQFVSYHAPPRDALWRSVHWFDHALSPKWEGRYVADSRGRFNYGDPEDLIAAGGPVQINLHPEWWFWQGDVRETMRAREAAKP